MTQALELATQALFLSNPNPRVGCVIVAGDGVQVLGTGFTQQVGGAHAEVISTMTLAFGGRMAAHCCTSAAERVCTLPSAADHALASARPAGSA